MSTSYERLITFDPEKLRTPTARRRFLSEVALAAGALSVAPAILRGFNPRGRAWALLAQQGGETEDLTDVEILQYALTLEYLEATFYLRGDNASPLPQGATIAQIDPDGNGMPGTVPGLSSVTPRSPATFSVPTFVRAVRDHEITHVLALQAALGANSLPRDQFAFSFGNAFASAESFLTTAQALEDTGVTAYLGQAGNIDSTDILVTAGTILQVEAEHASMFRFINEEPITPGDASFEDPATSAEVLAIADDFITASPPLPFVS